MVDDLFEVLQIPGVGQQVIIYDLDVVAPLNKIPDETRTDKPGSPGHENSNCTLRMEAELWIAAREISSEFASNWLATRIFARSNESKVPASDHQPSTMA